MIIYSNILTNLLITIVFLTIKLSTTQLYFLLIFIFKIQCLRMERLLFHY